MSVIRTSKINRELFVACAKKIRADPYAGKHIDTLLMPYMKAIERGLKEAFLEEVPTPWPVFRVTR